MISFATARYYLSDEGLQEKTSPLIIKPTQLQIAQNVHFYENGAWTKRAGYIKRYTNAISGTPIITGAYEFIKRDGTKYFITSDTVLRYGSQGDASPSTIGGGLTFTIGTQGENLMSFITFADKVLGANGIENIWSWPGSGNAAALGGSPPISKIIATYQNFVFIAGNSTYPYRLYFSNDGDETTWTASDYIDIGNLTFPITGLAVLFGKLYIFNRKSMYELSGYDRDTFTVNEVTLSVGCVAHRSIVKVENNLIFWSDRGLYSFDGVNVHYMSESIQNTVAGLNYTRTPYIVGEIYKAKDQVWFAVSTGSNANNNQVICMTFKPTIAETSGLSNVLFGQSMNKVAFAVYTGMAFNCFALETSSNQLDRLYAGGYNGLVYQQDMGNDDDGAGIDFKVKTPPIDMGSPEDFKRFRYLILFVKQQGNYNLSIAYKTDFGFGGSATTVTLNVLGSVSLWGTAVWGTDLWGGATIMRNRVGLKANGHHLEIGFSNAEANQPISIKGFTLMSQLKGISR